MELNSALKQIDHILNILKEHQSLLNFDEIKKKVDESALVIEPSVLGMILEKLERDKYIFRNTSKLPNYFNISFEGNLFIGYQKQRILDDEGIITAQNNASQAKIYANRLLWATWCAGIAAVLLLLWQVWVWFYPVHANYPYWIWQTIPKKP